MALDAVIARKMGRGAGAWLALLVVACGANRGGGPSGKAAEGAPDGSALLGGPTSGCGQSAEGTDGFVRRTISVGGGEREYYLLLPQSYEPTRPYPLVFRFHGFGGNGVSGGLEIELAAGQNAIIVAPSGVEGAWDLTAEGTDVALFDALLPEVGGMYCVDTGHVFVYGFSMGGALTTLLGCMRSGVVRAIATVAGSPPMTRCGAPVAAWFAHSPDDEVVTIDHGRAARDLFLGLDGCSTTHEPVEPAPCVRYQGCGAGFPVDWCEMSGGHAPQGDFTAPGAWAFFSGLP